MLGVGKKRELLKIKAIHDKWTVMSFPSGLRKGKATNESYRHRSSVLIGTFDHRATQDRNRLHMLFYYAKEPRKLMTQPDFRIQGLR